VCKTGKRNAIHPTPSPLRGGGVGGKGLCVCAKLAGAMQSIRPPQSQPLAPKRRGGVYGATRPASCGPRRSSYNHDCCRCNRVLGFSRETLMCALRTWFSNVFTAIKTVSQGMYVTLWYFVQTYRRQTFTERFEYPELPVPVKPRYRGFHRYDLTTCIGCDK